MDHHKIFYLLILLFLLMIEITGYVIFPSFSDNKNYFKVHIMLSILLNLCRATKNIKT